MTLINYLTGEVASSHIKPKQQPNGGGSSFCAQQASVGAFPCGLQFPTPPNPFPHHGHQLFSSIPHLCSCPTILPFPFIHSLCLWRAQSFLHERKLQHLAVFTVASSFTYFPLPYLGECFPNPGKGFSLISRGLFETGTHPNGKHHINSWNCLFRDFGPSWS